MPISELSRRVGVSTARLRSWERRYGLLHPRRTRGNYRMYSAVDEARVRLMQRHLLQGVPAAQAAELAIAARFSVVPGKSKSVALAEAAAVRAEMREALDRFDETGAQRALERLFATFSPSTVLRDVLLPYLHEVGERWSDAHISVAQEHFASSFLHARFLALARGWDRGLGPRAVLACAPGDQHTLGLIAFGVSLHQTGWRITYLGADTPVAMAAETADLVDAELVVITAAIAERFVTVRDDLAALARRRSLAIAGGGASAQLAAGVGARHLSLDPVSAAGDVTLVRAAAS
jgi:DNA-binding transcriptional MerR regulator